MKIDDLAGKRALITGASSGIGAAVARALGEQGVQLAVHYRSGASEAEAVASAVRDAGGAAAVLQADIATPGEAGRLVEEAAAALGGLDILINNAGSLVCRRPFMELDDELIDAAFDLNVRAVIAACQAAVPHMEQAGGGAIINVGSIAASTEVGRGPGTTPPPRPICTASPATWRGTSPAGISG